ncbi:hypothetical protein RO3G_06464 [Rhizopus delemar RA 99-880]|uniref:Uncharacterized protein n=1 Tax=Rhizopus delemar (strain RA 99-880 / ATCC MYA-4621 / FGSC 9543 / NRRL 43880) TaxID=246409 RepID=I1BZX9_RHIO9|nr:hypothetical protein RO3G_06464 [Rhizopus delemar RA 99-880]|eukprot:EIE81759.1 hypothetical protein RO3G_06464 [Rhizopus delemar RA 99-880]
MTIPKTKCTNQNSKVTMQNISGVQELCERLWGRDLAVCLNMAHVVRNLRLNGFELLLSV